MGEHARGCGLFLQTIFIACRYRIMRIRRDMGMLRRAMDDYSTNRIIPRLDASDGIGRSGAED